MCTSSNQIHLYQATPVSSNTTADLENERFQIQIRPKSINVMPDEAKLHNWIDNLSGTGDPTK